jgi:hypothetical protein
VALSLSTPLGASAESLSVSVSASQALGTDSSLEAQEAVRASRALKPVVVALTDLKKSIAAQLKEAEKAWECRKEWCNKNLDAKYAERDEAQTRLDDARASVEENKAKAEMFAV